MLAMSRPTIATAAAFFLSAALASTAACAEPEDMKDKRLAALFRRAVVATGEQYLAVRDAIVAEGEAAVAFLAKRRETGKTWEERILAEILLERIEHTKEIGRLLEEEIEYAGSRSSTDTARMAGKALAERFKAVPMTLVEFVWKRNELRELRKKGSDYYPLKDARRRDACVAWALGLLGEKRAMWPLIRVLEQGKGNALGGTLASDVINMIGSPEALEELIRIAETGRDEIAREAARAAMAGCVSGDSLPVLEGAAAKTKDKLLRSHYQFLLSAIKRARESYKTLPLEHVGDLSGYDMASVIFRIDMSVFLSAYERQIQLCCSKLAPPVGWKEPARLLKYIYAVKTLRAAPAASLLAPRIACRPLGEDPKIPRALTTRQRFPVFAALEGIGMPAVPAILKELKTVAPKDARTGGKQARDLLVECLIAIFDQAGYGKELARTRIELEMKKATGREKGLLQKALEHPLLQKEE